MKPRSTTLHRGADDERDAIRRYLKRLAAKRRYLRRIHY